MTFADFVMSLECLRQELGWNLKSMNHTEWLIFLIWLISRFLKGFSKWWKNKLGIFFIWYRRRRGNFKVNYIDQSELSIYDQSESNKIFKIWTGRSGPSSISALWSINQRSRLWYSWKDRIMTSLHLLRNNVWLILTNYDSYKSLMTDLFAKIDTDFGGEITREEFAIGARKHPAILTCLMP